MEGFKSIVDSLGKGFDSIDSIEKELLKRKDHPDSKQMLQMLRDSKKAFNERDLTAINKLFDKATGLVNKLSKDDRNTGSK